jgi:hypothetical protein
MFRVPKLQIPNRTIIAPQIPKNVIRDPEITDSKRDLLTRRGSRINAVSPQEKEGKGKNKQEYKENIRWNSARADPIPPVSESGRNPPRLRHLGWISALQMLEKWHENVIEIETKMKLEAMRL